jgi:hypothetical protein
MTTALCIWNDINSTNARERGTSIRDVLLVNAISNLKLTMEVHSVAMAIGRPRSPGGSYQASAGAVSPAEE